MNHELKTLPRYFERVLTGEKTFELRKNDRDFQVGDQISLLEFNPDLIHEENKGYTGRIMGCSISYIFHGGQYGLESGYCILRLTNFSATWIKTNN